jgi:hypothetical protein
MKTQRQKYEDLNSGKWIIASEGKLRNLMIWPNKVYHSVDGTKFIILLQRSPTNAFSFCVNNIQAFDPIAEHVKVRLTEVDGTFVAETDLDDVIDEVEGETPLPSKFNGWGDFFWLTEDFKISRPGEFASTPPRDGTAVDYILGRKAK